MSQPPKWSNDQLKIDLGEASEIFRRRRMEEPLDEYTAHFDECQSAVEELLESTVDLTDLDTQLVAVLTAPKLLEAFRYLAGPPLSADDLKVVAEAALTPSRIRSDLAMAARIKEVILSGLDRRRFPWVIEGRDPTEIERHAAIVGSAALIATRRLETGRRSDGKREQEAAVKEALKGIDFKEVPARRIDLLTHAPEPGEFCPESHLAGRKADLVVRLWDQRMLAIECKVSNSSTNSVKRLNNDAAVKAKTWLQDLGPKHVVPAAVLGGVYKLHNLVDAQERGLSLFWAHDLGKLTDWIQAAR